jgi:hypothetical protein
MGFPIYGAAQAVYALVWRIRRQMSVLRDFFAAGMTPLRSHPGELIMRPIATLMMALSLITTAPAFADHAVNNARETARAAYRAADAAENLADAAYSEIRFGGGGGVRDHRHDNLEELAEAGNALHFSLSDLYRTARAADGPWRGNRDHRGDDIRSAFERVRYDFYRAAQAYDELDRYSISPRIHQLYQQVSDTYSRLEWTVGGQNLQPVE